MTQEINRRLHEALGKDKYAWVLDYKADARLVIEAMRDHPEFLESLFSVTEVEYHSYLPQKRMYIFDKFIDLIMDTTGKLALLAKDWLDKNKP